MTEFVRHARILVIGHVCLDSVSLVSAPVPVDGKLEAERIWVGPGGPATNAAIALRRLGHHVRLAVRFGDDAAGEIIKNTLVAEGIELLCAPAVGGVTSLAQIRAQGDARSVVWKRGTLASLESAPEEIERWMRDIDLLYVDGHEVDAASVALQQAAGQGTPAIGDLGSMRPGSEAWPSLLDSAVATPRWLDARYPDARSLEDAVARLSSDARDGALVGVTLGGNGGLARRAEARFTWRARKTGAVDTTVAGDAFHAGLADAMIQDLEVQAGLDWAATLAASVCRAPGHSALPVDRAQLQLWHGRWGHRPAAEPGLYSTSPGVL